MNAPESANREGPWVGSTCLASPGGPWQRARIERVNEDGSFIIEFDERDMAILPYWYGLTASELSFNDEDTWPAVAAQLCPDGLCAAEFPKALSDLGYKVSTDEAKKFWLKCGERLFEKTETQSLSEKLTTDQVYQLFLKLRLSAKACQETLSGSSKNRLFKLYSNQLRMGGRDPDEAEDLNEAPRLARAVTLDDACAALGLQSSPIDPSAEAFFRSFEQKNACKLPKNLKALLSRDQARTTISIGHPNNPYILEAADWKLFRRMREKELSGDFALVFMTPHQGEECWAAVFDEGEDDARIYVFWEDTENSPGGSDGQWIMTAPTVALFFWDIAQTGLIWYIHAHGRPAHTVRRSDIGLLPVI